MQSQLIDYLKEKVPLVKKKISKKTSTKISERTFTVPIIKNQLIFLSKQDLFLENCLLREKDRVLDLDDKTVTEMLDSTSYINEVGYDLDFNTEDYKIKFDKTGKIVPILNIGAEAIRPYDEVRWNFKPSKKSKAKTIHVVDIPIPNKCFKSLSYYLDQESKTLYISNEVSMKDFDYSLVPYIYVCKKIQYCIDLDNKEDDYFGSVSIQNAQQIELVKEKEICLFGDYGNSIYNFSQPIYKILKEGDFVKSVKTQEGEIQKIIDITDKDKHELLTKKISLTALKKTVFSYTLKTKVIFTKDHCIYCSNYNTSQRFVDCLIQQYLRNIKHQECILEPAKYVLKRGNFLGSSNNNNGYIFANHYREKVTDIQEYTMIDNCISYDKIIRRFTLSTFQNCFGEDLKDVHIEKGKYFSFSLASQGQTGTIKFIHDKLYTIKDNLKDVADSQAEAYWLLLNIFNRVDLYNQIPFYWYQYLIGDSILKPAFYSDESMIVYKAILDENHNLLRMIFDKRKEIKFLAMLLSFGIEIEDNAILVTVREEKECEEKRIDKKEITKYINTKDPDEIKFEDIAYEINVLTKRKY